MRIFVIFVLAALTTAVNAHQQKEAYTTVLFNERSGNIEVAHQFLLHDAEHALAQVTNSEADIVLNPDSQRKFASYIASHFSLRRGNGTDIVLESIGFEVEGKYIWIYQEAPLEQLEQLSIRMTALQEVWSDQINHINVERAGAIKSLRLKAGDDWQVLLLNN